MSAFNWFETQRKAHDLYTKQFTTASGVITYTAKTGTVATTGVKNGGPLERFIRVTTASTYSLTITIPDGVFYGQKLDVLFEVEGGTETITCTTDTGDNGTSLTGAGGYNRFEWHGTTLGWALISSSAT